MNATEEEVAAYALFAVREQRARRLGAPSLPWSTRRPLLILRFLASREERFAPTLRDVAEACDIGSTSVVAYWYRQLRQAGFVTYEDGLTRTIVLTPEGEAMARS